MGAKLNLEKVGKLLIKACTVGYTGTISWMVISGMSQEMPPILGQFLIPLLIIGVIEAVLVVYWHLLDTNQDSTVSQRMIYIVLMLLAYIATQVIGLGYAHDILQGAIGITVRLVMLGAMGASAWERGVLDAIRSDKAADKSVANSKKVREHKRKVEERLEIEAIDRRAREIEALEEARSSVAIAFVRADQEAGLHHSKQHEEIAKNTGSNGSDGSIEPIEPAWLGWSKSLQTLQEVNDKRQSEKSQNMARVAELRKNDPTLSHGEMAKQLVMPRSTVSRYIAELEKSSNGHKDSANV